MGLDEYKRLYILDYSIDLFNHFFFVFKLNSHKYANKVTILPLALKNQKKMTNFKTYLKIFDLQFKICID